MAANNKIEPRVFFDQTVCFMSFPLSAIPDTSDYFPGRKIILQHHGEMFSSMSWFAHAATQPDTDTHDFAEKTSCQSGVLA